MFGPVDKLFMAVAAIFLAWYFVAGDTAMETCLESFSETTCNYTMR